MKTVSKKASGSEKKQTVSQTFDLGMIEDLRLYLTDKHGNVVLALELNRQMDDKPQLVISTGFTEGGDLKSATTIYDIDA